jgi:hypothetical protein
LKLAKNIISVSSGTETETGEELLESGAIAVYQDGEEYIVDFEILESAEDILQTRVKVIGIN